MKLGNSRIVLSTFLILFYCQSSLSEDKIISAPLINLNELKPSFEEVDNSEDEVSINNMIKQKKIFYQKINFQMQSLLV